MQAHTGKAITEENQVRMTTDPKPDFGRQAMRSLAGLAVAILALVASSPVHSGTAAIDNSVQLDPFNPVPEIQFSRGYEGCNAGYCGGCEDGCEHHCWHDCYHGWRGCYHDCRPAGWYGYRWRNCVNDCRYGPWACEHNCWTNWYGSGWRDCDNDCREGAWRCERGCAVSYRHLLRDYDARSDRNDEQADRYDEQSERYDRQSDWYRRNVIERGSWYDGHAWHISPLLPLPNVSLTVGAGTPPPPYYDAPPPAPYGAPPSADDLPPD